MATSIPKPRSDTDMSIPQIQLNGIAAEDEAKGAVVHTFEADATPEQKAAVAAKGEEKLKAIGEIIQPSGAELPIATSNGNGPKPTVTAADAKSAPEVESPVAVEAPLPENPMPGDFPVAPARPIPDWFKIGWREVGGIDKPPIPPGEERDRGLLAQHLNEMYYGEWYHNAAVIFVAVFMSHLITLLHMGWGWLFILLAFCATYYTTSVERVRRRARDDIQRELMKTHLETENETAEWLNNFLNRFWIIYEPVLSKTIISSVDQILSVSTPSFLDSIRMTTFTLGSKAPKINHVRTHPRTLDDIVLMEWAIAFTPNDISDITPREAERKVNPKVVLEIRLGKGMVTAGMPILLEDITFTGRMQIRMKLMTNFPHVQIVDISFLEKPVIDYSLKPVGGETFGMDIASIPGLSSFIRDMVHATLGPMMYDPNVFTLNLEQMLSGVPLDAAIGVVQVTIHAARGIKGQKIGGGTPDPYVSININGRKELARTKYKSDTYNPTWNETKFIVINNLTETLNLVTMDFNDHRKDFEIGTTTFDLNRLVEDTTHDNLTEKIFREGKDRGDMRFDIAYYPVLTATKIEGVEQPLPYTTTGIVRFVIHQAKELDSTKSMSGELNPLAKVYLRSSSTPIHTTSVFKHTNNPVWEAPTEFLCADRANTIITVKVIDDRDFLKDPVVGFINVKLEDLLSQKSGQDWWPLGGCKTGKIRLSAQWKPLELAGSLHGAGSYVPPIGVIRLLLKNAVDLKNVEAALGGKSDPYIRVMVGDVVLGRTEVVNNNLNPTWDQFLYIPVHSLKETVFLECMDYQHLTKDRSLGSAEIHMADLARATSDIRYPYEASGKKIGADGLRQDKSNNVKGTLNYEAEFIPALHLKGLKFDGQRNPIQQAADDEEGGSVIGDNEDEETQKIPDTVTSRHVKGAKSTDTMMTIASTNSAKTTASANPDGVVASLVAPKANGHAVDDGVELSKDELLQSSSGIVIFDVISGQLARKGRLEILIDGASWPVFSTPKARSNSVTWDQVGEGFIKELEFGRVWIRINADADGDKEDIIAEIKCEARQFLERAWNKEETFTLLDSNGQNESTVQLSAKFVPVPIHLEPRESFNNQGLLRVSLIDGRDVHGADRSGKSDPYVVFTLNDEKIHKSEVVKKTLNPVWNEKFETMVPSRATANFDLEVFDWNQIDKDKSLGKATINLADLEPFEGVERTLSLSSAKHGDVGFIKVFLLFEPTIIMKTRKNTSAVTGAGRAMTQVGSMPLQAGRTLTHGAGGALKGIFKKDSKEKGFVIPSASPEMARAPDLPAGQDSTPVPPPAESNGGPGIPTLPVNDTQLPSLPTVDGQGPIAGGSLRVTVIGAKDISNGGEAVKPYVFLKFGDKDHETKHTNKTFTPEWEESFTFNADSETRNLRLVVKEYKPFGKDPSLGEADIDIWRHLQPTSAGPISAADVNVELREGSGQVRLRLEFEQALAPRSGSFTGSRPSISSRFSPRRKADE